MGSAPEEPFRPQAWVCQMLEPKQHRALCRDAATHSRNQLEVCLILWILCSVLDVRPNPDKVPHQARF